MKVTLVLIPLLAALGGCGPKDLIGETHVAYAPPRSPNCSLELVQVDPTSITFRRDWQLLGYVTLQDRNAQDPMAEGNSALARPRACAMGGTSIAIALNSTTTDALGRQHGALVYMVLRPRGKQAAPTAF